MKLFDLNDLKKWFSNVTRRLHVCLSVFRLWRLKWIKWGNNRWSHLWIPRSWTLIRGRRGALLPVSRSSAPGVPELLQPLLRPPLLLRKLGPPRARQTCRYHVSDTRIIYIELITWILIFLFFRFRANISIILMTWNLKKIPKCWSCLFVWVR